MGEKLIDAPPPIPTPTPTARALLVDLDLTGEQPWDIAGIALIIIDTITAKSTFIEFFIIFSSYFINLINY